MKQISILIAAVFLILLNACNFSKGVKKDLSTGLNASYNGFGIEDIYLAGANGSRLSNNKVPMGAKLAVVTTGVKNYAIKDGKAFPGCRIVLTDKAGKEVINLPDAFSSMVNGTPETEASTLQATLNTGDPMVTGETYHLAVRFFDKQRPESEIKADIDLLMTQ